MKLSELKPCAKCGGKLEGQHGSPIFYVINVSQAVLNPTAINHVLGMHQYFQGKALGLAELMAPDSDEAAVVLAEQPGIEWTKLFLCMDCGMAGDINIAELMEKTNEEQEKSKEA